MTAATMAAIATAKERQLDWLLAEVLGAGAPGAIARARPARAAFPWLSAAIALLAAAAAVGVALLREPDEPRRELQQPAIRWHECHGAGALDGVPAAAIALKCFDFDDAACARLAAFPQLEHLDLSGMDVGDTGYATSLPITDAGVRALAPLTKLRSLSLATCHQVKGQALQVLEAMPRLESLDLTYSGVETAAVERLVRLPALRTLVLSHCMAFHGEALAAVASMPGLRRLELRACVTVSAADALHLAKLKELRHLDLRDCQGRFRGQTMQVPGLPDGADPGIDDFGAPKTPVPDGVGITDAVVTALADLELETLLLGGSESLTDAIGPALAKLTTLRALDLSNLPKVTGALLPHVPPQLTVLGLDHNEQLGPRDLRRLPALPHVRELGLGALSQLDDATLRELLAGKQLTTLRLGGTVAPGKGAQGAEVPPDLRLTSAAVDAIVAQQDLVSLALDRHATSLGAQQLDRIAGLPRLRQLDLTLARWIDDGEVAKLAASRSLRALQLVWCPRVSGKTLAALADVPLRELNLYGTKCDPAAVRQLATKHWPGCLVTMPNGKRWRAP